MIYQKIGTFERSQNQSYNQKKEKKKMKPGQNHSLTRYQGLEKIIN